MLRMVPIRRLTLQERLVRLLVQEASRVHQQLIFLVRSFMFWALREYRATTILQIPKYLTTIRLYGELIQQVLLQTTQMTGDMKVLTLLH